MDAEGIGWYTRLASPFQAERPTSNMDAEQPAFILLTPSRPRDPLPIWMQRDWPLYFICFPLQGTRPHFVFKTRDHF